MERMKITMENLLAGLLCKFGEVDLIDVDIVVDYCICNDIVVKRSTDDMNGLAEFVEKTSYGYLVKDDEVRRALDEKQGELVRSFLEAINVEDMALKRALILGVVPVAEVADKFNKLEVEAVDGLVQKGLLRISWNDDVPHEDYEVICLTKLGEKRLFELECFRFVEEFRQLLQSSGYDVGLMDDFLVVQDFTKGVYDILNLDNFLDFCNTYDRAAMGDGISTVNYRRLNYSKEEGFDSESKDMFNDLLSVWDDGHCIHICHPNHIFATKYLDADNHDLQRVNWDEIDFAKMVQIGDYKTFILPDCKEAFRYVHKRLGSQIMKKMELEEDEVSYLAVLEKYRLDGEDNYLLRGIIRGDKEGYAIGFNPEYEQVIPKSIWEKSVRFSGNEVLSPYLVKRNGTSSPKK